MFETFRDYRDQINFPLMINWFCCYTTWFIIVFQLFSNILCLQSYFFRGTLVHLNNFFIYSFWSFPVERFAWPKGKIFKIENSANYWFFCTYVCWFLCDTYSRFHLLIYSLLFDSSEIENSILHYWHAFLLIHELLTCIHSYSRMCRYSFHFVPCNLLNQIIRQYIFVKHSISCHSRKFNHKPIFLILFEFHLILCFWVKIPSSNLFM